MSSGVVISAIFCVTIIILALISALARATGLVRSQATQNARSAKR